MLSSGEVFASSFEGDEETREVDDISVCCEAGLQLDDPALYETACRFFNPLDDPPSTETISYVEETCTVHTT